MVMKSGQQLYRDEQSEDIQRNLLPHVDAVTAFDGHSQDGTIRDEPTLDDRSILCYPQWATFQAIDPSFFPGASEDGSILNTSCSKDCLPRDQFVSNWGRHSGDHQVDASCTAEDFAGSPSGEPGLNNESLSIPNHSLHSPQPPPRKPGPKRKAQSSSPSASKSARRRSTRDGKDNAKRRGSKPNSTNGENSGHPKEDVTHKRIQERNRIAANKFRVRKRENIERLQSEEQNMEKHNITLSNSVDKLITEIHQLKMQLLQHSDCNCTLIQDYIRNDAQRYIQSMEHNASVCGEPYSKVEDVHLQPAPGELSCPGLKQVIKDQH
ncbi:hypothetical protein EDB80DRAFT_899214 [Ilyonectria destructans]|nr:hypothetical protein EDB80DRAFT_899214 [Ilyonectria destructans]